MKVAVVGATGFIGRSLIEKIVASTDHTVVALSRTGKSVDHSKVVPVAADFFSLRDAERALNGCDIGIYLLHSMSPSNRLSQGDFADFDFILADNFARAARKCGLKQIIYVSGMISQEQLEQPEMLSKHLASRLEVEEVLAGYGVPLTTLRGSLVIGARGSSFIILKKLVYRLPLMGLPKWVNTPCQPIFVDDLISIIMRCIDHPQALNKTFDCGAPELLTYRRLIEMTAEAAGLRRRLIGLPAVPLGLSKLWVRLIAGASRSLVYPLIDSLKTPMLIAPERALPEALCPAFTPIAQAIRIAVDEKTNERRPLTRKASQPVRERSEVRSVQRLPLPAPLNAFEVARLYFRWLPRFLTFILRVENVGDESRFFFTGIRKPLLILSFSPDRSTPDRQLFYIRGGLLALPGERGRLEFREQPGHPKVFAAIHDFRPALPWWLYRLTQAWFHSFVMKNFARFLLRREADASRPVFGHERSARN